MNEACALAADQLRIVCQVGKRGSLLEYVKQRVAYPVMKMCLRVDSAAQQVVTVPVGLLSTPALNLCV